MLIADDLLEPAHLTEAEVRIEIALALFAKDRLTLGQAARLAGLPHLEFQREIAGQRIPIHYDVAEFQEDLKTLERLAQR